MNKPKSINAAHAAKMKRIDKHVRVILIQHFPDYDTNSSAVVEAAAEIVQYLSKKRS